jgi:hypothetical protein
VLKKVNKEIFKNPPVTVNSLATAKDITREKGEWK